MKTSSGASLFLALAAAVSCRTSNDGSSAKSFEFNFDTHLPVPACTSGESASLMLEPLPALPAVTLPADWPKRQEGFPDELKSPEGVRNVRFDICLDESSGEPKIRVQNVNPEAIYSRGKLIPEASAKISGLEATLYEENYAALDIVIPFETSKFPFDGPFGEPAPSKLALHARGLAAGGQQFAIIGVSDEIDGKRMLVGDVLVGRIVVGNPDDLRICKDGSEERRYDVTRGTARFTGVLCEYTGTSGTRPYGYAQMEITDTSPELPEDLRGVAQKFEGEALAAMLTHEIPHHNICEATRVKTPTAVYAWRMFSGNGGFEGSCPRLETIPEAPFGEGSSFADEIAWTIKYANGVEKKGVGGGHPLRGADGEVSL